MIKGRINPLVPGVAGLVLVWLLTSGAASPARAGSEAEEPAAAPVAVEVGAEAPDFELAAPDGTGYRLSSLRGEKPVVLVFYRGFW